MTSTKRKARSPFPLRVRSPYDVGNAIKRLRIMNKLSQTSLALKAGVTQATISRIEKGQQKADVGTFLLLLVALGADLSIIRQQKVSHPDSLDGLF